MSETRVRQPRLPFAPTRRLALAVLAAAALPAVAAWGGDWGGRVRHAFALKLDPIPLGLTAEQADFADALAARTAADARSLPDLGPVAAPAVFLVRLVLHDWQDDDARK